MIIMDVFVFWAICVLVENLCSGIWRAFISKEFTPDQKKQGIQWSYLHMNVVYILFPVPFLLFMNLFSSFAWYWIILIIYPIGVVGITLIETGLGALCMKLFNFCPWGKYTADQDGIMWLGGYSRYKISLTVFGLGAIAFYFFSMLHTYCVRMA
jgi:hypothetical protein